MTRTVSSEKMYSVSFQISEARFRIQAAALRDNIYINEYIMGTFKLGTDAGKWSRGGQRYESARR